MKTQKRKINFIAPKLIGIGLVLFAFSCSNYDARWFQNSQKKDSSKKPVEVPNKPIDMPPADQDPFLVPTAPKENDGGFAATKFQDWRLKATFDSKNVPAYTFFGSGWTLEDAAKHKYSYNGADTNAGSNSIRNVKYYQYRNRHPQFPPDNTYNQEPHVKRLERFYFYWFYGETALPKLDNALIAVDSYSKLVFAYAKPTSYKTMLGNQLPTSWGPFEATSSGPGGKQFKFYEYDPIGYVKPNGQVSLFSWYVTAQGSGDYDPRMQFIAGAVASASNGTAGKSPYFPMDLKEESNLPKASGRLTVTIKKLENQSVVSQTYDRKWAWTKYRFKKIENKACYVYNFQSRSYSGLANPKYDVLMEKNKGNALQGGTLAYSVGHCIDRGKSATFDKNKVYNFANDQKNMNLDLSLRLFRYNYEAALWNTVYGRVLVKKDFPANSNMKEEVKILNDVVLPLKYDRDSNSWKAGDNTFSGSTVVQYDKNFSVGNNEEKELAIKAMYPNDGTSKIVYSIKWEGNVVASP